MVGVGLDVGEARLVELVEGLFRRGRIVGVGLERPEKAGLDARDLLGVVCRGKRLEQGRSDCWGEQRPTEILRGATL